MIEDCGEPPGEGRHASNLELFLDLVFVFAVTQIATLISHDPTAAGLGRGMVVCLLVWWQWSQFTWAGSAIDLQGTTAARGLVLCLIPVTLLMAASIPTAVHGTGLWFGACYLVVQLLVISMHGVPALASAATRTAFLRYASLGLVAPVVVLAAGSFHGAVRVALWGAAGAMNVIGGLWGGGEWRVDPVHFAERHGLIVIIALGEELVAAGATVSATGMERSAVVAALVASAVACAMWWTYFSHVPEAGERLLRATPPSQRASVARDLYTFGHFPVFVGLVMFAVVIKDVVASPLAHLTPHDRWLLALSVLCFAGGMVAMQLRVSRRTDPERVAVVVLGVTAALGLGAVVQGRLVVLAVAAVYASMQALLGRRYAASESRPIAQAHVAGGA